MQYDDKANAPTEVLIQQTREHHRIATLSGNQIIRDYYKTQALSGNERVTRLLTRPTKKIWSKETVKLIRETTKRLRRLISEALKQS